MLSLLTLLSCTALVTCLGVTPVAPLSSAWLRSFGLVDELRVRGGTDFPLRKEALLSVAFQALGEQFEVQLSPLVGLKSSGARIRALGANGEPVTDRRLAESVWAGALPHGGFVRATVGPDGAISAHFLHRGELHTLEPLTRHWRSLSTDARSAAARAGASHLVYRASERLEPLTSAAARLLQGYGAHTRDRRAAPRPQGRKRRLAVGGGRGGGGGGGGGNSSSADFLMPSQEQNVVPNTNLPYGLVDPQCPSSRKVLPIGIAVDPGFAKALTGYGVDPSGNSYGQNVTAKQAVDIIEAEVLASISILNVLYTDQTNVFLRLMQVEVQLEVPDGGSSWLERKWAQEPLDHTRHQGTGRADYGCPASRVSGAVGVGRSDDHFATLEAMATWRKKELPQKQRYGMWQLLTNCFDGDIIGLSYIGSSCSSRMGVGWANLRPYGTWDLMAHEMGHTLGSDDFLDFITDLMRISGRWNEFAIVRPESRDQICSHIASRQNKCYLDYEAVCGNKVVEPGEECDDDTLCCDSATCKLVTDARCTPGMSPQCCTSECQFASAATLCGLAGGTTQGFCYNGACRKGYMATRQFETYSACVNATDPCFEHNYARDSGHGRCERDETRPLPKGAVCGSVDNYGECDGQGACDSKSAPPQINPIRGSDGSGKGDGGVAYMHVGCFWDKKSKRIFKLANRSFPFALTHNVCAAWCVATVEASGAPVHYVGVEAGRECWCGAEGALEGIRTADRCTAPCTGDAAEACGGAWAMTVFELTGAAYNSTTATITSSSNSSSSSSSDDSINSSFAYVGCFRDAPVRVMQPLASTHIQQLTPELCGEACKAEGCEYFGLQFGSMCFCGDSYDSYGTSDSCTAPCDGDATATCGGSWANSVYKTGSSGRRSQCSSGASRRLSEGRDLRRKSKTAAIDPLKTERKLAQIGGNQVVTVATPSLEEVLYVGTVAEVSWQCQRGANTSATTVSIVLTAGSQSLILAGSYDNSCCQDGRRCVYSWTLDAKDPAAAALFSRYSGSVYRIELRDAAAGGVVVGRSSPFTVAKHASVHFAAPSEDQVLLRGHVERASWTSQGKVPGLTMTLNSEQGEAVLDLGNVAPSGTLTWVVPSSLQPGQYYLNVASSNGKVSEASEMFVVAEPPSGEMAPLAFVEPQLDEYINPGDVLKVAWTSPSGNIGAQLYLRNDWLPEYELSVPGGDNANTLLWTVQASIPPATGYYLTLRLGSSSAGSGNGGATAESVRTKPFTIAPPQQSVAIEDVFSGQIGERWAKGGVAEVEYGASGADSGVRLELMRSGQVVAQVASASLASPAHWQVPAIGEPADSSGYYVRATVLLHPQATAQSDLFPVSSYYSEEWLASGIGSKESAVRTAYLGKPSDSTGGVLVAGASYQLEWSSWGVGKLKVELTTPSGTIVIADSMSNLGQYTLLVPLPGEQTAAAGNTQRKLAATSSNSAAAGHVDAPVAKPALAGAFAESCCYRLVLTDTHQPSLTASAGPWTYALPDKSGGGSEELAFASVPAQVVQGVPAKISWTGTGVHSYVSLSVDAAHGGGSWLLAAGLPTTGSLWWTPGAGQGPPPGSGYTLRAAAAGDASQPISISSATFQVLAAPALTGLEAPAECNKGEACPVTWVAAGSPFQVQLQLFKGSPDPMSVGGQPCLPHTDSSGNTVTKLCVEDPSSAQYGRCATAVDGNGLMTASDACAPPTQTMRLIWTMGGPQAAPQLSSTAGTVAGTTKAAAAAAAGTTDWLWSDAGGADALLPRDELSLPAVGSDYFWRVVSLADPTVFAHSAPFSIGFLGAVIAFSMSGVSTDAVSSCGLAPRLAALVGLEEPDRLVLWKVNEKALQGYGRRLKAKSPSSSRETSVALKLAASTLFGAMTAREVTDAIARLCFSDSLVSDDAADAADNVLRAIGCSSIASQDENSAYSYAYKPPTSAERPKPAAVFFGTSVGAAAVICAVLLALGAVVVLAARRRLQERRRMASSSKRLSPRDQQQFFPYAFGPLQDAADLTPNQTPTHQAAMSSKLEGAATWELAASGVRATTGKKESAAAGIGGAKGHESFRIAAHDAVERVLGDIADWSSRGSGFGQGGSGCDDAEQRGRGKTVDWLWETARQRRPAGDGYSPTPRASRRQVESYSYGHEEEESGSSSGGSGGKGGGSSPVY